MSYRHGPVSTNWSTASLKVFRMWTKPFERNMEDCLSFLQANLITAVLSRVTRRKLTPQILCMNMWPNVFLTLGIKGKTHGVLGAVFLLCRLNYMRKHFYEIQKNQPLTFWSLWKQPSWMPKIGINKINLDHMDRITHPRFMRMMWRGSAASNL